MINYIVRFSEIGTKGLNRGKFEKKLLFNIKMALNENKISGSVWRKHGKIFLEVGEDISFLLRKIPGIKNFSKVFVFESLEGLKEFLLVNHPSERFEIDVKRTTKDYPKTSLEVRDELLRFLRDKSIPAFFKAEKKIYVEYVDGKFYLSFEKEKGLGGLPVGSEGRVVALISGGFDSPLAAFLLMKRGAALDVFHLVCDVEEEKLVREIVKKLKEYHSGEKLRYFVGKLDNFLEIVERLKERGFYRYVGLAYRHYLYLSGMKVARKTGGKALVVGDSLGQVASQTINNLYVVRKNINFPIFSPLIGFDKDEIIELSKKLGFFEICAKIKQKYSFMPKHPITNANEKRYSVVKEIVEENFNLSLLEVEV